MLTKTDLANISKLIQSENQKLEKKLNSRFEQIDKQLKKQNDKLDTTISFFDKSNLNHEKRIKRIEAEMNLEPVSA